MILNEEKLKVFPLKSGMRRVCPLPPLLFNVGLEFLVKSKNEKEIKGIQIEKKKAKLSLLTNDMVLYLKDPKDSTRRLISHIQFQQSRRIQNQHTTNNSFSIHQQ
jgi:hypothetical protein